MTILVRSSRGDASTLAQPFVSVVREIDPDQPLYNVLPLDQIMKARLAKERAMASVMNLFAVPTLLVAALGVHAAMSYVGIVRRREVGVRLALGASRADTIRTLCWRGGKQVLVGLEVGIVCAVILVSVLRAWSFSVPNRSTC